MSQKDNKKKAVSLIVLIISIVVLSVISAVVIINVSNTNIINEASKAIFKTDMAAYKEVYNMYIINKSLQDSSFDMTTLNLTYKDLEYTNIFGSVPDKYKKELKVVKGKLVYITTDEGKNEVIGQLDMLPNKLNVKNNLVHCTTSNTATSIAYGKSYTATLTVDAGYTLQKVTVVMDGENIIESVYNSKDKTITINKVTDNVVITAITDANTYTITNDLTQVISSNTEVTAKSGTNYKTVLTSQTGHTLKTVKVTMAGVDVTSSVYNSSTNTILINSVTGDIIIAASATPNIYSITNTFINVTTSNTSINTTYGSSYTAKLTPADENYIIKNATVTVNGVDVTVSSYNSSTNTISLNSVVGDLVITAEAGKEIANASTSYVGFYADTNNDGIVDGVIFADLLKGGEGTWGATDYEISYEIPKVESAKEYYVTQVKYDGKFGSKPVLTLKEGQTTGNDRFYVMSISDVNDNAKYSWYYSAWSSKISDFDTVTSTTFGSGKTNTNNMLKLWNEEKYGEKDANTSFVDMWGVIQSEIDKGWFVPSKDEWVVFLDALNITISNNTQFGLETNYWSLSLSHAQRAWSVDIDNLRMYSRNGIGGYTHVRLAIVF